MALKSYFRSSYDPRRIKGLFSWWDFSDSETITLDSGRIAAMRDKSGNGWNPANTSSGSTQPTYTLQGQNGLNVASFAAASSQRLQVPSSTSAFVFLHDGTPCWWIVAGSYGSGSNPNATYIQFATNGGGLGPGLYYAFEDSAADGGNNGISISVGNRVCANYVTPGYPPSTNNIVTPQTPTIQEMSMDVSNATLADRAILRINGGAEIKFNTYSSSPTSEACQTNFTIGALFNGSFALQGELYEMLFFNRQPSAAECDYIRRGLSSKWRIAIA